VNGLAPPFPYPDCTFDFVYTLSIFTHLSEALQFQWVQELSRVLGPKGFLLVTTHGEYYLTHNQMSLEEQEKFKSGQLAVRTDGASGTNTCGTFHPFTYLRDHLAKGFDIIDFVPEGAKGNPYQDASLLRKA
jgi:SAM-dependent methyltransferase